MLKPKGARYLESDGNGLSLDILSSGKMPWLYRYRLNSVYGRVTLRRYPDMSLKPAPAKRNELATLVAEGVSPAQTIHDLRRTGATLLTEKGFNADVVENALNHSKQGIRAVYIVAEHAAERKRMLQWWADHVDSLVQDAKADLVE